MASRGKHLLEAFRVAGPNAPTPPHAAPSAASSPQASSPSRPSSVPTIGSLSKPSASAPTVLALNAPQLRLFGLVVLLLVVVAFLFGRISVSRVSNAAAAPNESAGLDSDVAPASLAPAATNAPQHAPQHAPQAPPQASQPPVSPQVSGSNHVAAPAGGDFDPNPRTPAEQALLDRANVYTIKLIHYSNTEANKRLAAATARYVIEQQNLPAVVAADSTGLYILVGAAPRQVDLDGFLARAKKMPGPPPMSKPGEFHSAYVEKIDRVFRREK